MKDVAIAQATIAVTPVICIISLSNPPPYSSPPSVAKTPTNIVPNAPHTPCTDIAPTATSIFNLLSINSIENTTTIPQIKPIISAPAGLTAAQPAVTPTNPAKTPFKVIEISGFL